MRSGPVHLLLALGALWLLGCDISPQPAPPGATPEIHAEAITMTQVDAQSIELRGSSGAAPASTSLRIANVELAEADAAIDTDPSGGFVIVIPGQLAHVFRLNAVTSDGSAELDISGTTSGAAAIAVDPAFSDCLSAAPESLTFGPVPLAAPIETRSITLTNACAQPLVIFAFSLRDGGEFVPLGPGPGALPLSIAPAEQTLVEIGFKSLTAGTFSDFALVRFSDATGPRRIFALDGTTTP